jgi:hypothetical protein
LNRSVCCAHWQLVVLVFLIGAGILPASGQIIVEGELTRTTEALPGESYRGTISIANPGSEPQQVKVYQSDYAFDSEGRVFYNEAGTSIRSNAGWITFFPSRATVPRSDTVAVDFEVLVPDQPGMEGTYWSVLMVEGVPSDSIEASGAEKTPPEVGLGVVQLFRYAIQIVTHIGSTGAPELKILAARLEASEKGPVLLLDVGNNGTRWLRPTVWADLYDTAGVAAGRSDAGALRIYPETSVRYRLDLAGVPPGLYKALVVLDGGGENVYGASYTLDLKR